MEADIKLIYELNCLRHIQRAWKQFFGPDFANLAEHHLRVAWLALVLAKQEGAENHEKILKMALVHDVPESRTGDVHYISRLYTERNETQAVKDIFGGTSLSEFSDLWQEYQKHDCIESKIVKDADSLDVSFELHEQAFKGDSLEKEKEQLRQRDVYPRLYTKSAKKMWDAIKKSNPHDWHLQTRNRHNAGDWSESV